MNCAKDYNEEQASLEIIDYCSRLPRVRTELINHIESSGVLPCKPELSIELSKNFKLIQEYEQVPGINESVYHTPLFIRENIISIANILRKLPYEEKEKLEYLLASTRANEANPISSLNIDIDRLNSYNKIGIFDITNIETSSGRTEGFIFTPDIWGPLGTTSPKDEQEHVRALLSCIRFGQICPTQINGKTYNIKNPELYIEALKRNGKVGPATPIGSDYIILEREGIVQIEASKEKPGQFEMILLKDDIADRASRILSMGRDEDSYKPRS